MASRTSNPRPRPMHPPPSQAGDVASNPRSLYREPGGTRYARTVSLPQEVDSVASQARFDNGVLSLQLAKRRPDGAHTLTIG
jgi:HSP20 family protein